MAGRAAGLIVVIDASTFVCAALKADSLPERALLRAVDPPNRLILSQAVEDEHREVVFRPKLDRFVSVERRQRILDIVVVAVERIEPTKTVRECHDPKDDKYLAPAAAGRAGGCDREQRRSPLAFDAPVAWDSHPAPGKLSHSRVTIRLSRHLAGFWMIEPEIAFADLSDNAALAEASLKYTFAALSTNEARTGAAARLRVVAGPGQLEPDRDRFGGDATGEEGRGGRAQSGAINDSLGK